MSTELEQQLARDLRGVADELRVPAMPTLDLEEQQPHPSYRWLPLLVAAVIAAIVASAMLVSRDRPDQRPPQPIDSTKGVSTSPPAVPYVIDGRLYLGGRLQPGKWGGVMTAGGAWAGTREDGVTVWGQGERITKPDATGYPQFSPDGRLAVHQWDDGRILAYDTSDPAQPVATTSVPGVSSGDATHFELRGVTNDGLVVLQNQTESRLWNIHTGKTLDLGKTAPRQQALPSAVGGIIWTDGVGGPDYLGEVDASGHVTRGVPLPGDDAIPNQADTWAVWGGRTRQIGQIGGYDDIVVLDLSDGTRRRLQHPDRWFFTDLTWETDETFLSQVVDLQRHTATVRCSVTVGRCVVLPRSWPEDAGKKGSVPTSRPSVPYVENGILRDGDRVVPGSWKYVTWRGDSWVALRKDGKWFWDLRPGEPEQLRGVEPDPVFSPNGRYLASGVLTDGKLRVQVFETRIGGEGLGLREFPSGGVDDENHLGIVAVTDTGRVVLQSVLTRLLWIPETRRLVELDRTTEAWVHGDSLAGTVWGDGLGSDDLYLGDIDDEGHVTRRADLPVGQMELNSAATYGLSEGKVGSFGDQTVVETVVVHALGGGPRRTVRAPAGWRFLGYSWETDDRFLGGVVDKDGNERTARCGVAENRCVLVQPAD